MDLPVAHQAFRARRLAVRTSSLWRGPQLLVDGAAVGGKRLTFQVRDDSGNQRTVVLKPIFLDPVPKLQVDAETPLALARPLLWYEWAWMAVPMLLAFTGGGLGAFLGILAVWTNTRIFRSDRSNLSKYVLSGSVNTVVTFGFVVAVTLLQVALNKS